MVGSCPITLQQIPCKYNYLNNNNLLSHHGMREEANLQKKEVFIIHPPSTQECGSLSKNPHLQKFQQKPSPQDIIVSPFYNPTGSSNRLTTLDILTLVSQFVLLAMSLHFDLSTYLLLCQVILQSVKSIYSNALSITYQFAK